MSEPATALKAGQPENLARDPTDDAIADDRIDDDEDLLDATTTVLESRSEHQRKRPDYPGTPASAY